MTLGTTRNGMLFIAPCLLAWGCAVHGPQRHGASAPPALQVFAPGVVSTTEPTLFRGQFSPDGSVFYFFRKVTPDEEDYRVFVTRRGEDGWEPARRVDLGGEFSDLYPTVSPDDRFLVFSSYRPVKGHPSDHRNANLWFAERENGGWGRPRLLDGASTFENYDAGPHFDTHGDLVWTSISPDWTVRFPRRLPWAMRSTTGFRPDDLVEPWRNALDGIFVWGGVEDPLRRFIILGVSELDPETGRRLPSDLWIVHRSSDGWEEPRRLGPVINTPDAHENFVVFTPDGTEMLFCRGFQTYYRVSVDALLRR